MLARAIFTMCLACLAGCSNGAASAGIDRGAAPPVEDVGDDKPNAAEPGETYDLELPPAGTLPLGKRDALRVGDAREIDMTTAWEIAADASVRATFDRSDVDFTRSELWSFSSKDGKRFSKARKLDTSDVASAALVGSPSIVDGRLYFLSSSSMQATPTIHRWAIGDGVSEATSLPRIAGVDWMLSWPKFEKLAGGAIGVAFRDGKSVPRFARSDDGKKFGTSVAVAGADEPGAMPSFGEMSDGTLAFTFQQEDPSEAMISYAVLSHDRGATWSERIRVSQAKNVHDTSAVTRADGAGVDLYYVHTGDAQGFSLYRRSLGSHGGLGPEERVTSAELGEPSKPSVVRKKDGRLLVAWSEIVDRSAIDSTPVVEQVVIAELASDASL